MKGGRYPANEDTRIGDALLPGDGFACDRPSDVPCPMCAGELVIDDAVVGRALSDAMPDGGEFYAMVQFKPDDVDCLFCNACDVGFFAPSEEFT